MSFGNTAIQNPGVLLWDGISSAAVDLRHYVKFGLTFQVMTDLTADTTFNVLAAPPDAADPCIAGPFAPVEEVLTCSASFGAVPLPQATITLPAGTTKDSLCMAALPCKPGAFLALAAAAGETDRVRVVTTLSLPK
jgi:hypothetical protein